MFTVFVLLTPYPLLLTASLTSWYLAISPLNHLLIGQRSGAYKAASFLVEKLLSEAVTLREQLHLRTVRLLCLSRLGRLTLARAKLREVGEVGKLDSGAHLHVVEGVTCMFLSFLHSSHLLPFPVSLLRCLTL